MNTGGEYDYYNCDLGLMPNWSYSYALALYKLSFMMPTDTEEDEMKTKAFEALKTAVHAYPLIPKLLLEKNNINITGRSFQTDWPSVLSPLRELSDELSTRERLSGKVWRDVVTAKDKITSIFVERSHKLWCGEDVVKLLFDCCQEALATKEAKLMEKPTVPLALIRYADLKLDDFQDSFPHIPVVDALDPRLVDAAMNVRPNARRMLRLPNQRGDDGDEGFNLNDFQEQRVAQQIRTMFGTGRDDMTVIDPDLPIAEIFWRSLLPWNRVDGV